MPNLKEIKNSTLLTELNQRLKLREIRFTYDRSSSQPKITGLISWSSLDQYCLDFTEIEALEEKFSKKFAKKPKTLNQARK